MAAADDEPGFLTAWLQPRSLERQIHRREEECQHGVLAGVAKEIGGDGVFEATHTHVSHIGNGLDHVSPKGKIDQNLVSQGEIKTLKNDSDIDGGGREGIEHTGIDSMASLDNLDGQSSQHAHLEPPQVGASCIITKADGEKGLKLDRVGGKMPKSNLTMCVDSATPSVRMGWLAIHNIAPFPAPLDMSSNNNRSSAATARS